MTNKQQQTLVLFAQNYSIPVIAKKQKVAITTIRTRLKQISKYYPNEFDNALSIRRVNKRLKRGIKYPGVISDTDKPLQDKNILDWF